MHQVVIILVITNNIREVHLDGESPPGRRRRRATQYAVFLLPGSHLASPAVEPTACP